MTMDEPSYRVISVSLPKQPDRCAEEELNLPSPYYRQHSLTNAARSHSSTANDLAPSRQSKQDASVEARISLDLGIEATTQTEDAPLEEPLDKAENIDENASEKTYEQRLNALSNELAEIRMIFDRIVELRD
jgi:hypothetical protein